MNTNCTSLVPHTVDISPIRSPQATHSFLASRFAGHDLVEIGTRNGDAMACFSQVTRSAVAIEYDAQYCQLLRARANTQPKGGFRVVCEDFRKARLDADFIFWWLGQNGIRNEEVLHTLSAHVAHGTIRRTAEAVILFDMAAGRYAAPFTLPDRESWQQLRRIASWTHQLIFDESADCEARVHKIFPHKKRVELLRRGVSCERARGTFMIAGFALNGSAPLPHLAEPASTRHGAHHDHHAVHDRRTPTG
jgi:hypothetical protein